MKSARSVLEAWAPNSTTANLSKSFCALPFQHLSIGPEGTASLCCVTSELVTEHGSPMSLYAHSMEEIWNSAYMRRVRRAMVTGEPVSACNVCYFNERVSGESYRTTVGVQPLLDVKVEQTDAAKFASRGYVVSEAPRFVNLKLGNLCNLKCRMCYSAASSQIERDHVHNKWSGPSDTYHSIWKGDVARIGPEPRIGIKISGVSEKGDSDEDRRYWTDGRATFSVPIDAQTKITRLELEFGSQSEWPYQVVTDGIIKASGIANAESGPVICDLEAVPQSKLLTIEILSNRQFDQSAGRERGIPLRSIRLFRDVGSAADPLARPELLSMRRSVSGPWYTENDLLFGNVIKSSASLERLYITGGEPLINSRVLEILGQLVSNGDASHIDLELSTNCTVVDREVIDVIKKFRRSSLLLSLDAVGGTYEYIRHPARWSVIENNVRRLVHEFGTHIHEFGARCFAVPVVQINNIFSLVDLFKFCEELGLEVSLNVLDTPERLAIRNLPPKTRLAAAAKFRRYLEECTEEMKQPVSSLIQFLESPSRGASPEIIREFMLFTNDLDFTQKQDIRQSDPELVSYLAEDGFPWIDDLHFAKEIAPKRRASESVYAHL